jgi:hypothetical protein
MGKGDREGLIMIGRSISVAIVAFLLLSALIPSLGSNKAIPPSDSTPILSFNQANAQEPELIEVDIPVRGTFLRAEPHTEEWGGDGEVEAPAIVDLRANGILGDSTITMTYSGQISLTGSDHYMDVSTWIGLDGLFSSSSELLSIDELHRVPGAIASGYPFITAPVFNPDFEPHPTDIPEDFYFGEGWSLTVPRNAMFLFICMDDSYYPDNTGNIQVTIDTRKDTDGDGLYDSWEKDGIDSDLDGTIDLDLPGLGADWEHKDIFVEVDYMQGHRPMDAAMDDVKMAFSRAPNYLVGNPDGKDGINLHVQVDEQTIHQDVLYVWEGFDSLKSSYFGSLEQRTADNHDDILLAKKWAFRYCLFIHQFADYDNQTFSWNTTTASGVSELPGNDFIVSLGPVQPHGGTEDQQAAAFMHELGHALNLRHGGDVNINYKPNYLSIMNYLFEFDNDPIPNRPLDYSRSYLSTLDETHLDEMKGITNNAFEPSYNRNWAWTAYSNASGNAVLTPLCVIDWNNNSWDERDVSADINNFTCYDYPSYQMTSLTGYEDWSHLLYSFINTKEFADGVHLPVMEEITWDTMEKMQQSAFTVHDVAILNVSCPSDSYEVGGTLTVNVTVMNGGTFDEQTEVLVMLDSTEITSQDVSLAPGETKSLRITHSLGDTGVGSYPLSIQLTPVNDEFNPSDNSYDYGNIQVNAGGTQEGTPSWVWIAVIGVIMAAAILIAYVIIRRRKG